jgi:hypothetical protein
VKDGKVTDEVVYLSRPWKKCRHYIAQANAELTKGQVRGRMVNARQHGEVTQVLVRPRETC